MKNLKLKFDVEGRPELSTAIQTRLFALGYAWAGEKRIQFLSQSFLYCEFGNSITYGDERAYFDERVCASGSLHDLYDLKPMKVRIPGTSTEVTKEQLEKALEKFND